MSSTIKNVAVAGATGNTGPTVIKTLCASGFKVDYLSHDSLVSALRGNDAIVVCGVGMLPEQTNLIDAAIAAGVSRFLPADFAGDLTVPLHRTLRINQSKIATLDYLRQHEARISHNSIRTGPLLDFCLSIGVLVNMKDRAITLYDAGDKRFSTTTIATASRAVVAVLKMDAARAANRAFRVQDVVTTQNRLLELAKEVVPGVEWTVTRVSTADLAVKAKEAYEVDPESRMGAVFEKGLAVFGAEYVSDFGAADNEELGITMMDEAQVKEVLRRFV